uniref:Uncharacterized protein n=1 Tax=Anguilla anguilla TaxID=7936 RepID=A0A0E9XXG8_ANGAN
MIYVTLKSHDVGVKIRLKELHSITSEQD